MSGIAYLRNGIVPGPKPTYFDIQPAFGRGEPTTAKMQETKWEPFRQPLIPNAAQIPHTQLVLGLKPSPFSMRNGIDAGPMYPVGAHQGYGRHQNPGLAFKLNKEDNTTGKLLVQADSTFAGLNSRIPLPN